AGVDAQLVQWLGLLSDFAQAQGSGAGPQEPPSREHAALSAAGAQLAASLAEARGRPLDASATGALAAGMQILEAAWQSLVQSAALRSEGVAPPAMAPWLQRREQLGLQSGLALREFNAAVEQYNAAVAQFPASMLAWLFGFQRAQAL